MLLVTPPPVFSEAPLVLVEKSNGEASHTTPNRYAEIITSRFKNKTMHETGNKLLTVL
jgi:hypothetical protein